MAFEPGGYADKLGNRYEGRWIVKQLLRLLQEQLTQVVIEAVGGDQPGVDLWVTQRNGHRQAQQCKARNGSAVGWTVSDLNSRGVLAAMRLQLDRSDIHEFAFVSALPADALGDICDSARQSSGDPEDFFRHQIDAVGDIRRKAFRQFCEYLGIDFGQATGRAAAYQYLRRIHTFLWADDMNSHDELLSVMGFLTTGTPETVLAVLADFAENNLRRTLTSNDLRAHLSSLGFYPRKLAHDSRVAPAVDELQMQFEQSIRSGLIAGGLLHREETTEVLEALKTNAVVVVHGPAGLGKTGVLFELTQALSQHGFAYIPVRLDRTELSGTPRQFGENLGLPESPALCLEALDGEDTTVLILDQLDALRWTSAHSARALDVCKALVGEVLHLRDQGRAMCVVLACRTFDLEHDPEISNWLKKPSGIDCREIEVKALPEVAVKRVVEAFGKDFQAIPPKQKLILQSPQHLAMWAELARAGEIGGFQTGIQLMRHFWDNRYRELAKSGIHELHADEVIDRVVAYMESHRRVSAPFSLIADRPNVAELMQSLGILRRTGSLVNFYHQSYLDFRIATRLLKEMNLRNVTVHDWLGDRSQQSLFRREQLRQVLSMLIEESPSGFLANMQEVIAASDVRFHLKHLILELVGQLGQPDAALLAYLRSLLGDGYWREHVFEVVLAGHPHFVEWLHREGTLAEWLESQESRDVDVACGLLRSVSERSPDLVAEVLEPFSTRNQEWAKRILSSLCWNEQDDSDRMFELRLDLARRGIAKEFVSWPLLAGKHPLRAIKLIEAIVSTWTPGDSHEEGSRPSRAAYSRVEQLSGDDLKALLKVAADHAEYVWDQLMPHIERLTEFADKDAHSLRGWQDGDHLGMHEGYTSTARGMVELVIEAGKNLAHLDAAAGLARIRSVQGSRSQITQTILTEMYAALPRQHADEGIAWLMMDSGRLSLGSGEKEPEWMPAVRLISEQSPYCAEDIFRRLESWLVHYHDPDERRIAEQSLGDWRRGWFRDLWGRAQYFLLPALCSHRRFKESSDLFRVLERKFGSYDGWRFLRHGQSTVGWVGSPLPTKKLEHLSDKTWLGIISSKRIPTARGRLPKQIGPDVLAESSVRTFSRDLARLSKRFLSDSAD